MLDYTFSTLKIFKCKIKKDRNSSYAQNKEMMSIGGRQDDFGNAGEMRSIWSL